MGSSTRTPEPALTFTERELLNILRRAHKVMDARGYPPARYVTPPVDDRPAA